MDNVYQNQNEFEITVPTPNGSGVNIPSNKYVQGSYFALVALTGLLVEVDGNTVDVEDIVFYYPESGIPPGNGTNITSITTTGGLTGGGSGPSLTLSIADSGVTESKIADGAITASKIASGNLVKSVNSVYDSINLIAGLGIDVTTASPNITIVNTAPGILTTNASLPLTLTWTENTRELAGAINITPANDGGAVALQSSLLPTLQLGVAGLTSLYLSNVLQFSDIPESISSYISIKLPEIPNLTDILKLVNSENETLLNISVEGNYLAPEKQVRAGSLFANNSLSACVDSGENNPYIYFDLLGNSYISVPFLLMEQLTVDTANNGKIVGTNSGGSIFEFDYVASSNNLIDISTNISTGTIFNIKDNSEDLIKLNADGSIFAKRVQAETITSNVQFVNTATTINLTTNSPQVLIADCSNGVVIAQLPEIKSDFEGTVSYKFKKIDISNNALSVVPNAEQTIDGDTDPYNLITTNETLELVGFYNTTLDEVNWYIIT